MLTRSAIRHLMKHGFIKVIPEPIKIGPNSIDLRLGYSLKMYAPPQYDKPATEWHRVPVVDPVSGGLFHAIDPKNPPPLVDVPKLTNGSWLLVPGQFYLGVTLEETYCRGVVPHLDGRSTCGRLSIEVHKTAGVGDNGFQGRWTLEIEVTEPVLVRPGDRLLQIYFSPAWGEGLAIAIASMQDRGHHPTMDGSLHVAGGGILEDGGPHDYGALIELHDLYGQDDGGHHYQKSEDVQGAKPLD